MARYLADTNILLRFADLGADHHPLAAQALVSLALQGHVVLMVPQCLYEFWVVASRPTSRNGLGWEARQVRELVDKLMMRFPLVPDTPAVFTSWLELVSTHEVLGKQAHGARLVAAMRAQGIGRLLTLNSEDFKRYAEVQAVHPSEVTA
ncbi:MAG: PIN domain nuclease [Deinococcota bacterium]|jgi:predicted nucleic acid-binding protein|nr:PIN domain nuclease [Deinococcota bacterium]